MKRSSASVKSQLGEPVHYFPLQSGRYELKVGLHQLGYAFGNGIADSNVFQLDKHWPHYRQQKLLSRHENLRKYVCVDQIKHALVQSVTAYLVKQLLQEYPDLFLLNYHGNDQPALHCKLSGEVLLFTNEWDFIGSQSLHGPAAPPIPPYDSALDALACQIQEDLAISQIDIHGQDRLTALHVCFPNHWAAQQKIGRSFAEVHHPVPDFERIARHSKPLLKTLTQRGPFVRFAWGLATDTRLNHHPLAPPKFKDKAIWKGRAFSSEKPKLYLRIERQVLIAVPNANAFVFTIRSYFEDVGLLNNEQIQRVREAIVSMSDDTLRYKGIAAQKDEIISWLGTLKGKS